MTRQVLFALRIHAAALACAIADGAEVVSDFRVISDQEGLLELVALILTM